MKPLVSVNITTYNRAELLPRCLNSVLVQDYSNLEIIVVDDCSTDNTKEVIRNFIKLDDRVNYYSHDRNKGNAFARNTALSKCTGEYIAFLDDDDEWIDKSKILKQVEIFRKSKDLSLAVVCTGIVRITDFGNECVEVAKPPRQLKQAFLSGGVIHNSTALVRGDIARKVNGFSVYVKRGIDSEFFRRLVIKGNYNVHFMSEITCKYYENSTVRLTKSSKIYHLISHIWNLFSYFKFYILYPKCLITRVIRIIKVIVQE